MSELKNCPFCGEAMQVSPHPVDMWAVCPTAGCIGARQIVVLEDAKQVAAWNRRASSPPERKEALAAARRMLEPIEPDGSYAVDGFFKDAALVASAMLAASKETER